MRFELKVIFIACCLSAIFMMTFTYAASLSQKTIYAYQVGIYKDEKNMQDMVSKLKKDYHPQYYKKDNQFYVLSLISDDEKKMLEHAQKVKGIIKKYRVYQGMSDKELLKHLSDGEIYD